MYLNQEKPSCSSIIFYGCLAYRLALVYRRRMPILGRYFDVAEVLWPDLCARQSQLLSPSPGLLGRALPAAVEAKAQTLAVQLIARAPIPVATAGRRVVAVDLKSLALTQPRSVGVEQVVLHDSWTTLWNISVQRRVNVTFTCQDGCTLHLRKATRPEPKLLALYQVLGIHLLPGAVKQLVV